MSGGWQPSTSQLAAWAVPGISSIVPEFSSQSVLHLLGNVDNLVKSGISIALNVFLLLSVFWWFEGFDDQGRGRRQYLSLGPSLLNTQFHCNPQALPFASHFGNVITNLFWRQAQGGRAWGPGQMWHWLPHYFISGVRLRSFWGWTSTGRYRWLVLSESGFGTTRAATSPTPSQKFTYLILQIGPTSPQKTTFIKRWRL